MIGIILSSVFAIIGAGIAVVGGIFGFRIIPNIIEEQITENVVLIDGTSQFSRWVTTPFPMTINVYMFNITNPDEVLLGGKPALNEIGPYVYRQFRTKEVLESDDSTVTYEQNMQYFFDSQMSGNLAESDDITVVNVPLNAVVQVAERDNPTLMGLVNLFLNQIFGTNSPILTTTVGQFLFEGVPFCVAGNPALICNRIDVNTSKSIRQLDDGTLLFSVLEYKNNNNDGIYTIDRGVDSIADLGRIISWQNETRLYFWKDENNQTTEASTCNMINGTDSTIYRPIPRRGEALYVFNSDLCRSIRLNYRYETETLGVPSYRYESGDDLLVPGSCFCMAETEAGNLTDAEGCLLMGAQELWPCQGAPTVFTRPHFLGADERYQSGVEGLAPDESKHQIFVELERYTGTPLSGARRAQFNMFLRPVPGITSMANLATTLTPFLWIEEGFELTEELSEEIKSAVGLIDDITYLVDILKWVAVGIGSAIFIICFICFTVFTTRSCAK